MTLVRLLIDHRLCSYLVPSCSTPSTAARRRATLDAPNWARLACHCVIHQHALWMGLRRFTAVSIRERGVNVIKVPNHQDAVFLQLPSDFNLVPVGKANFGLV